MVDIMIDPFPDQAALARFWPRAWNGEMPEGYPALLSRSLVHLTAEADGVLVGFVNVAWDGGQHAFILDTAVDRDFRHQGIATRLVKAAAAEARNRGASWLHVDFEPHLEIFYRGCGFRPTLAGLIAL
jgi:GNAT superfamily N-acetyltransferase